MSTSLPIGSNGRGSHGRFARGDPSGPGNPHARHVGLLRPTLLGAVTAEEMRASAAKLVERAKAGDLAAAREVLTPTIGKPTVTIDPDRDFDEEDADRRAAFEVLR